MSSAAQRFDGRGLIIPVGFIVAAELAARATGWESGMLAPPSDILTAFWAVLADGTILHATLATLATTLTGLAIGAAFGLVSGILLGLSRTADRLMEFSIEAFRPIPAVALIPIALLVFGFGFRMEISIVAFAAFWPILILSRAAIAGVEPRLLQVARALGFGPFARIWKIVLPAALPRIFVAFRLSAGIALIVAVTVEIAANPLGLGYNMILAQQTLRPELMLALLVLARRCRMGIQPVAALVAEAPVRPRRHDSDRAMIALPPLNRVGWQLASIGVGLLFIVLWYAIAQARLVSPVFLPGPERTWDALVYGVNEGDLLSNTIGTVKRMIYGWLLASLVGVVIGAMIGVSAPMSSRHWNSCVHCQPRP